MSFIRGDGLRKVYDPEGKAVEALHNVNFRIEKGEFVSLLGPSGCGKSTLLKCVAGLEDLTTGDWAQILLLVRQHRLGPLLHWQLGESGSLEYVPKPFAEAIAASMGG